MTRAFHLLVALTVAVPLGTGGLCCCLLGSAGHAPVAAAPEAPGHCCSDAPAPVPGNGACPVDSGEDDCGCPEREVAVVSGTATPDVSAAQLDTVAFHVAPDDLPREGHATRFVDVPSPPPKRPLYRTLSVLLC